MSAWVWIAIIVVVVVVATVAVGVLQSWGDKRRTHDMVEDPDRQGDLEQRGGRRRR
jgi:hypothetical protein